MQFKHLKITQCPECGCSTVVAERVDHDRSKVRTHCNGQQWEHREFLCGASFTWIPNFERADQQFSCRNTPEFKAKESARSVLCGQIDALQEQLRKI